MAHDGGNCHRYNNCQERVRYRFSRQGGRHLLLAAVLFKIMNADNATKSAVGNVEKAIVAMSDTKQETTLSHGYPRSSAFIRG